ncbi:MAG: thymidine kinase [Planctomycetota bacterium]
MTNLPARGKLEIVEGSMFGGKTERLIAELRQAQAAGKRVRAFKHCIDNRYDVLHLVTHTQDRFDAVPVPTPEAILDQCGDVDFIAIDEGQFFKLPLIPVVRELLNRGVSIIIAGISHDAWGRPFEPMPQLRSMADVVTAKQSPCRLCGKPSPFTQRMSPINTLHMVGGLDDYEPRCKEHFTPLDSPPENR